MSYLVPVTLGIAEQPKVGPKPKAQDNQKILPGYQGYGAQMWLGDVVEGAQLHINGKLFEVVSVDTMYTCSKEHPLQLDGNGIHVTLNPLE